jgi:tetratricopeptide (TPR) repeat protein
MHLYLKHLLSIFTILLFACQSNHDIQDALDRAENFIETKPDSALVILDGINTTGFDKAEMAHFALLKSMALDKNYIDTTTFDVLQPAIDYYLKKGSPNDKIRTYYYQGVIFENSGEKDSALKSYSEGLSISKNSTDSLTIARLYVAQGLLCNDFYDFENFVSSYLKAADIYKKLKRKDLELDCEFNVLRGCILLGNKKLGDSILTYVKKFSPFTDEQKKSLIRSELTYALKFGVRDNIESLIREQEANIGSINDVLSLALAYNKIGNNEKAKQMLEFVERSKIPYDTLRYLSISVPVNEQLAKYKEALMCYKRFSSKQESLNVKKIEQKAQSIEEKHRIEQKAQADARQKNKIIWSCIGGIVILILCVVVLILLVRSNRAQKKLALEKVRSKEAENTQLKSEKDNLALKQENLKLERDKKTLEAENLAHRVEKLEIESDSLKHLMGINNALPVEVQKAIQVRIEMLNSLLASYITDNVKYEKQYDGWIKDLTENTDGFMNSNRLAFKASHPRFIKFFEDHDLSVDEINYVCLYAIGLRGKEVGNYMKKRSHVNTSSAIRRKLGIDKHDTNLGIYVRKLLKSV